MIWVWGPTAAAHLTAERAAACRRLTDAAALERWASTTVRNWDGHEVGHIELSPT